jgi:hypothetical protein
MKLKLIETFLPPGVQAKMYQRIGRCPRQLPVRQHNAIMRLWQTRNNCREDEITKIDGRMEALAISGHWAILAATPRRIVEYHNMHGTGTRRHTVFVLPGRTDSKQEWDYWSLVTDVPCPCCPTGTIRWHEAGYVPGWRICDGCKRTFMASGDMSHPKLILDQ